MKPQPLSGHSWSGLRCMERFLPQLHGSSSVDKLKISTFRAVNKKILWALYSLKNKRKKESKEKERKKYLSAVLLVTVKPF